MNRHNLIIVSIAVMAISVLLLTSCGPERSETVSLSVVTTAPTATVEPTDPPTSTTIPTTKPSTTPLPTATPEPTSTPTQTPKPTLTPEPTKPSSLLERLGFTKAEPDLNVLAERLLTIEEMPAGWTAKAVEIEESDGTGTYDAFCKKDLIARSIGKVSVDFEGGGFGPFLIESISAYGSADDAKASFAEYKAAANECLEFTDDSGNAITLAPMSFPAYGDDSFAFRSIIGSFTADAVQIRVGDVLVLILQMGVTTDAELHQVLVEEALSKLDR